MEIHRNSLQYCESLTFWVQFYSILLTKSQFSIIYVSLSVVLLGVNAYNNYGRRVEEYVTQNRQMSSQPNQPPAFVEDPPSYEDAMRQTNINYSTGIVNMVS